MPVQWHKLLPFSIDIRKGLPSRLPMLITDITCILRGRVRDEKRTSYGIEHFSIHVRFGFFIFFCSVCCVCCVGCQFLWSWEIRITNASYSKNFDNRKNVFDDEQNSPAEIINLEIPSKKFESTLLYSVLFIGLILQMQYPKVYIKQSSNVQNIMIYIFSEHNSLSNKTNNRTSSVISTNNYIFFGMVALFFFTKNHCVYYHRSRWREKIM